MPLLPNLRKYLVTTYCTLDDRSLGLGRIVLALVLLVDLAKRVPGLTTWYSNAGLLPNHTVLWRPWYEHIFSVFFMASEAHEAAIGFGACAVAYLMLLFGYRTRWAQVLSYLAVVSLHGRIIFLVIGGDVVLTGLVFWTLFLPVGRRFSVDALWARLRKLQRADSLAGPASPPEPVVSPACLVLLVQFAIIYVFNAWQKDGLAWKDGSAVHYVLHLDSLVTWLGVRVRDFVTPEVSSVLTHATQVGEAVAAVALLFPVGSAYTRLFAIVMLFGLHLGFAALLNLGLFSAAMIAYLPNFLPAWFWDRVSRFRRRGAGGSPPRDLGTRIAESVHAIAAEPARASSPEVVGQLRPEGANAPWRVGLGHRLLRRIARAAVSRARFQEAVSSLRGQRAPFLVAGAWLRRLRTAALLFAVYLAWGQLGVENPAMPAFLRIPQSRWAGALTHYLQLFEGWTMFAPAPATVDYHLAIDAVTMDGRHVDPFHHFANPGRPSPGDTITSALGYDVYARTYLSRIAYTPDYYTALTEWILRHHERTGNPNDRIVTFTVKAVEDDSPPPGQTQPRNLRRSLVLEYPAR